MKKIILILILTLPVVVISLSFLIAGFIGRELNVVPVQGFSVDFNLAFEQGMDATDIREASPSFEVQMRVGDAIDLRPFIGVVPARASFFSLDWTSRFEDGSGNAEDRVLVDNQGVLRVLVTTDGRPVEIYTRAGTSSLIIVVMVV